MATTKLPTTYRVKGTTDEVTTCDRCGKEDLKYTVALDALDEEGNEDDVAYFGTDCASKATGRKSSAISRDAAVADSELRQRREWAQRILHVYEPVENASIREKAELYFGRNPGMRTKGVKASEEIARFLANARSALQPL